MVKSGKHSRRKITHQAQQSFHFDEVSDNSGEIQDLQRSAPYVFIKYSNKFSFGNKFTEKTFRQDFNIFVKNNKCDKKQKFWHSLRIANQEEKVCFCQDPNQINKVAYYAFIILGLALPFLLFFETNVARYEISLHKKLTLKQKRK